MSKQYKEEMPGMEVELAVPEGYGGDVMRRLARQSGYPTKSDALRCLGMKGGRAEMAC